MRGGFGRFLFALSLVAVLACGESRELVDLGIARFPESREPGDLGTRALLTTHEWKVRKGGHRFRVVYAHGTSAILTLERDHEALGRRFKFQPVGENQFRLATPSHCGGRGWMTCVYSEVLGRSATNLVPLLDRIESGATAQAWTKTGAARWLLAFVQQIPYRIPEKHPFGILPPALVASKDWGDCDSKSLLLLHLLERFGIDAIMLVSKAHSHALVGIAVPSSGDSFRYRSRDYAWAETTAKGAPLGWLPPGLSTPDDWRRVPIF